MIGQRISAGKPTTLLVKVSQASLDDDSLARFIGEQLAAHGVPGEYLVLQLPEAKVFTHLQRGAGVRRGDRPARLPHRAGAVRRRPGFVPAADRTSSRAFSRSTAASSRTCRRTPATRNASARSPARRASSASAPSPSSCRRRQHVDPVLGRRRLRGRQLPRRRRAGHELRLRIERRSRSRCCRPFSGGLLLPSPQSCRTKRGTEACS